MIKIPAPLLLIEPVKQVLRPHPSLPNHTTAMASSTKPSLLYCYSCTIRGQCNALGGKRDPLTSAYLSSETSMTSVAVINRVDRLYLS